MEWREDEQGGREERVTQSFVLVMQSCSRKFLCSNLLINAHSPAGCCGTKKGVVKGCEEEAPGIMRVAGGGGGGGAAVGAAADELPVGLRTSTYLDRVPRRPFTTCGNEKA